MAEHLNPLADLLLARDIAPVIWADMPLKSPSMAERLDRRIIMAYWNYGSADDCGKTAEKDAFNGASEFRRIGFRVWECGAGRSYGDSVFTPRYDLHLDNFDRWLSLAAKGVTEATLFRSWSVHLYPFSLQEPNFARAKFWNLTPDAFEKKFSSRRYGKGGARFFDTVRMISPPAPLSRPVDLGYNQINQKSPIDTLAPLAKTPVIPEQARELLRNYGAAAEIFRHIPGAEDLQFAARHLIFRAKLSLLLSGDGSASLRKEVECELPELEPLTRNTLNERFLHASAGLAADNLFLPVKEALRKHSEDLAAAP